MRRNVAMGVQQRDNLFTQHSIKSEMECALISTVRVRPTSHGLFLFIAFLVGGANLTARCASAEQVRVVQRQGAIHGFLLLKDADGKEIAVGDESNEVHGSVVSSRTIFRFLDGSVDDEETVFRQGADFRLIRDHRTQKGPSFPKPTDVTIDAAKGEVSWVASSDKGDQPKSQHMNLPADLANGIIPTLVENLPKGATDLKVSYLAVDSKPRLVTLNITPDGSERVMLGPDGRRAERFNLHVDIGGIAGVVAPIVGKQPADVKLWFVSGSPAAFVRMEGPFYERGPIWSVLLAAPTWPSSDQVSSNSK